MCWMILLCLLGTLKAEKDIVLKGCDCWPMLSDTQDMETECRCTGEGARLPVQGMRSLTIADPELRILQRGYLQPYGDTLRDVTMTDMKKLQVIEPGAFLNLRWLRTLYISEAQSLETLPDGFLQGVAPGFNTLRVVRTGLRVVPSLHGLWRDTIMHMIDLEGNRIQSLGPNAIRVKAHQVMINYNAVEAVEGWAFNGSEIGKLSLKGNRFLHRLADDAFSGLHSLLDLDLSETAITRLPTRGLENLEVLRIQDTTSLTTIPSVYSFEHLHEAWLTYSFHCCAFKYPARHDPARHALHQAYLATVRERCRANVSDVDKGQHKRKRRDWQEDNFSSWDYGYRADQPATEGMDSSGPDYGGDVESWHDETGNAADKKDDFYFGVFHQTTVLPPKVHHAICGNLSTRVAVRCQPSPDALNPCEDIMGLVWLRVCVWLVVITAVLGNAAVLLVLLGAARDLTSAKFLMCNLAFADLCMGLYLLLLASADLHSQEAYFNFAYTWQRGSGCQVAGFLTVFASQLSVFTLAVLTVERWVAITYALYLNIRLKLRTAVRVMAVGWLYSLTMATLPLVGVSNYSTTSICLPMETAAVHDVAYLVALLVTNVLAFVVVCVCYAQIYLSLGRDTRHGGGGGGGGGSRHRGEMTVAKRMALLVFTDFACWAPIAFFGLTAVAGYPLINVTRSKILLVFFYPLNSCANPYLYALLTKQYRRDFFIMLSRHGICMQTAQQYKAAYSVPTTNNSHPAPLLNRCQVRVTTGSNSGGTTSNGEALV